MKDKLDNWAAITIWVLGIGYFILAAYTYGATLAAASAAACGYGLRGAVNNLDESHQ